MRESCINRWSSIYKENLLSLSSFSRLDGSAAHVHFQYTLAGLQQRTFDDNQILNILLAKKPWPGDNQSGGKWEHGCAQGALGGTEDICVSELRHLHKAHEDDRVDHECDGRDRDGGLQARGSACVDTHEHFTSRRC